MGARIDRGGQKFGRWTVIPGTFSWDGSNSSWACRCVCGKEKLIFTSNLVRGKSTSCGCYNIELTRARAQTHGLSKTRIYWVWSSLVGRIQNPENCGFGNYGGRGLDVDPRWLKFENFYGDMGQPPTNFASLERKDNNRGYWPDNVIWADRLTQANNTSASLIVEFQGRSQTLKQWCRELDLHYLTSYKRFALRGWSAKKTLTTRTPRPFAEDAKCVLKGELLTI